MHFVAHLPLRQHRFTCEDISDVNLADLRSQILSFLRQDGLPPEFAGVHLNSDDVKFCTHKGEKVQDRQQLLVLQSRGTEDRNFIVVLKGQGLSCKMVGIEAYLPDKSLRKGLFLPFKQMETRSINDSVATGDTMQLVSKTMYNSNPLSAVEELTDNCIEGSKGQGLPEVCLILDQVDNVLKAEDNGVGVSANNGCNVNDVTSRGTATRLQSIQRKKVALSAAKKNHPETLTAMRSGVLGNFGWGLKGSTGYLLVRTGELRFQSKCQGRYYRTTWNSRPGEEEARMVLAFPDNAEEPGLTDEQFVQSSGTRIGLHGIEPSKIWGKNEWSGDGEAFLHMIATRLAGTYDAYLQPVPDLAQNLLKRLQALALSGSEDKVLSHSLVFRGSSGPVAKSHMEKALKIMRTSSRQVVTPERFELTVQLRYKDREGEEQNIAANCGDDSYKKQVYLRLVCQHSVSCLPLVFSVTGQDEDGKEVGGTAQIYFLYVPKAASRNVDLQAARRQIGLDADSEQMQVLWEMKALSDSVDLGLMAKARAIPEYKTDFNDLNMESIHGFLIVPKPFATSMSKSGLLEEALMKEVRRAISSEDVPHIAARWVRQMLNEHERMAAISQNGETLTANGSQFRLNDLVTLSKKRRVSLKPEHKPFEAAGVIYSLQRFHTVPVAASRDVLEDPVVCHLSLYTNSEQAAANETYAVPLSQFLLNKVESEDISAQPWPASLTPVPALASVGRHGICNSQADLSSAPILVGDTGSGQYCMVKDLSSGTRSGSSVDVVSCKLLQKFRWSVAQFEIRQPDTPNAEPFMSPVFNVREQTRQYLVSFGMIGTKKNEAGQWYFSKSGTYLVRLHLGQLPYAPNSLPAQVSSSRGHHAIEGTTATVCSDWYDVEVVEPNLGQADSFVLLTPLSEVQRGVPMDLDVAFKKGSQAVQLTAADIQTMSLEDDFDVTRNIEKRLGQSNGPQGALTCLTLKDVVITSDLGPVTISVTIYSSRLQQPLTCRLQCCIIAGKPSAIVTELHATDLVNHSLCDGLQLSLSFVDDKGGQITQKAETIRPCLLAPLSSHPSFQYVEGNGHWQANMADCFIRSPLYATKADPSKLNTDAIPVRLVGNNHQHEASTSTSTDPDSQDAIGFLTDAGDAMAMVLHAGSAVQYRPRPKDPLAMGVITEIHWGNHRGQRARRQDIKLTVRELAATSLPHVSVVHNSHTVKANTILQQLQVLSSTQAQLAFPGGYTNATLGPAIVICENLADVTQRISRTWDQIGCMCVTSDRHGVLISALCRFEHIDIQPSPQPVRMLLSKRRLSDLQTISTAQVAAGLAGPETAEQDEHGSFQLHSYADAVVDSVAALLLNEAGCPTHPEHERQFSLRCDWKRAPIRLVPEQKAYQLPAITMPMAYEPLTQHVALKKGSTELCSACITAAPTPDGVSPQANLCMLAQLAETGEEDADSSRPVICVGSQAVVVVNLMGTEQEAAAWRDAPQRFSLSNVRLGFDPETMVSAEVSVTEALEVLTASATLDTSRCPLGNQTLQLTATVQELPHASDLMDTDGEDFSTEIAGQLEVNIQSGAPVWAEFQAPPTSVLELSKQHFNVRITDRDTNLSVLPASCRLLLHIDGSPVKEFVPNRAGRQGVYTCIYDVQLLPGTHQLGISSEGADIALVQEQQSLAFEVVSQDFVVGITADILPASEAGPSSQQLVSGQSVAVAVYFSTHDDSPLNITEADLRRHCKVTIGSNKFVLKKESRIDREGRHAVLHGEVPATAGEHTLTASWQEERRDLGVQMSEAKKMEQQLEWTLPIDADGKVEFTAPVTIHHKPMSKLQMDGQGWDTLALSVGSKFPRQAWRIADVNGNAFSHLETSGSVKRRLTFTATISAQEVKPYAATLPRFQCNGDSSCTWEATEAEAANACFSLPEQIRQLSSQQCGLDGRHKLELEIRASGASVDGLAPLCLPFLYSDEPAHLGDIKANQAIVSDLQPEKAKHEKAVATCNKTLQDAEKSLQEAEDELQQSVEQVDAAGGDDIDIVALSQRIQTRRTTVQGHIDNGLADSEFRPPRTLAGPLHPASLGRRIALDILHLTCDPGFGDCSPLLPGLNHWTGGALSEDEGNALVHGASAALGLHLQGLMCHTGQQCFDELRRHHSRSRLLPIPGAPAAGSAGPQLQDYTLPGTAAASPGLLGFLCDAFSVLPRESEDRYLNVDEAAVRRGLRLWTEGALVFRTWKQAVSFAESRAVHGLQCPPLLALDLKGAGLQRLPHICYHGLAAPEASVAVDPLDKVGVLPYPASRLAAYLGSWQTKLDDQEQALRAYQHALDAVEQRKQAYEGAQAALQAWRLQHLSRLENAQKATSTSAKKRQAEAASQSRKRKVNRSAGNRRPGQQREEQDVIDLT